MALSNISLNTLVSAINTKAIGTTLSSASRSISEQAAFAWTEGTGASQVDKLYDKEHTITASGTASLDLNGGLTDFFGDALVFAKVKGIYIFASASNVNNVVLTRP